MMNELQKHMNNGEYQVLYDKLVASQYCYTLENFTRDFEKISSEKKYAFLMYAIASAETPDLHILICDMLYYTDTFFFDIYTVQKWHLRRALEISPNNKQVLQWIICTFKDHPSSPFSEEELFNYNNLLNSL